MSVYSNQTESSYYKFSTGEWMYARDARDQQKSGPSKGPFYNYDSKVDLSTPGTIPAGKSKRQWEHKPLIIGTSEPWKKGVTAGAHRSVWTDPDPSNFDVMSHDKNAGTSGKGYGEFVKGKYRPKKADRK